MSLATVAGGSQPPGCPGAADCFVLVSPLRQSDPMHDLPKRVVIGSMVVAGLVALAALLDIFIGVPFAGWSHTGIMDILFIISAAIVIYLGWDAYKDLS